MCPWTKRIEYEGAWLTVEAFLWRRFGLRVTHGMSVEALAALERELLEGR